jgi:tetratricopeptide (TPR) repeat protein
VTDAANSTPADKPKEPEEPFILTPEILAYENRRNDLIISAGVLLFAFFLGSFRDSFPDIPLRLATGRHYAEEGFSKTDPFSYGAPEGKEWVNPSWLFDRMLFGVFDSLGDSAAGAIKALCGALAVLPLLFMRHQGPTLWWTAFCCFLAAAGIAPRIYMGSEVVSLVMVSLTLMLWHASKTTGKQWLLWITVPLGIFWANIDPSVFVGALVLLALGLGEIVQSFLNRSTTFGDRAPTIASGGQTLIAAVLVFLASAATPYGQGTLMFPIEWFTKVLPQVPYDERMFFGWNGILSTTRQGSDDFSFFNRLLDAKLSYAETAWVLLIVGAATSFFLNFNRFSVSRLLIALLGVMLPILAARYTGPSTLLLAAVLSLNGQEAFLDAFGAAPRVSRGWVLWSQIGRMATILGLFVALIFAPTGRFVPITMGLFGFGLATSTYADPKTCQWLEEAEFKGNNFIPSAVRLPATLAWEAPKVKYFLDSRWQLFADAPSGGGQSPLQEYAAVQKTLIEDNKPDETIWKPFFAKHRITYVLFDPTRPGNIFSIRMWYPQVRTMQIKDRLVAIGNGNLPADDPDAKKFDALRMRSNAVVFNPPPPTKDSPATSIPDARMVGAPTIIDWLWRYRYTTPTGVTTGALMPIGLFRLEEPGFLFQALQEVRKGIAEQPDNPIARARLGSLYEQIYVREGMVADFALDKRFQAEHKRLREIQDKAKKPAEDAKKEPAKKPDENKESGKKEDAKKDEKKDEKKPADQPVSHGPLRPLESRRFIPLRHFQMMTAYRDALRAFTPEGFNKHLFSEEPPLPTEDLIVMADRAGHNGYLDASLEILKLALRRTTISETREELTRRIAKVEQGVEETTAKIEQALADLKKQVFEKNPEVATQTQFLAHRMQLYRSNGMPLKSLAVFEEASPNDPEIRGARIAAIETYLELGFAEKAQENLHLLEPNSFQRPGDLQYVNAMVLLAAGQYDAAKTQLDQSLEQIRSNRLKKGLDTAEGFLRGAPLLQMSERGPAGAIMTTSEIFGDLAREANLQFEIGLLLLEMGKPKDAIKSFAASLETYPRDTVHRPIMEYYAVLVPGSVKLPPEPPVYIFDDEFSIKFDPPPAPKDAPKKADDAKKAEPPKKVDEKKSK